MLNQAAIADILQLATFAGLSAPGVVEALRLGSANSRALELLNTMITADTVDHLASVEAFDAELFDRAMRDADLDAEAVTSRALTGAARLHEVIRYFPRS